MDAAEWERNLVSGIAADPGGAAVAALKPAFSIALAAVGEEGVDADLMNWGATALDSGINGSDPSYGLPDFLGDSGKIADLKGFTKTATELEGASIIADAVGSANEFAERGAALSNPLLQVFPPPDLAPLSAPSLSNGLANPSIGALGTGVRDLQPGARRPHRYANRPPEQVEAAIVAAKREKPGWGARKTTLLKRVLSGDPDVDYRAFRIAGARTLGPHASMIKASATAPALGPSSSSLSPRASLLSSLR